MHGKFWKIALGAVAAVAISASAMAQDGEPKYGGVLTLVVASEAPSWDGHIETTFGTIHPIAPFYSLLIRLDPDEPYKSGNFVCDLCTEMPKPTDGGKTYTFKIRQGVKFSDGAKHGLYAELGTEPLSV